MSVVNKYYKRALEDVIIKSFSNNKIVSILGARQCGKSTIIEHIFPNIDIISLKTDFMVAQAKTNPDSFIKGLSIPLSLMKHKKRPNSLAQFKN